MTTPGQIPDPLPSPAHSLVRVMQRELHDLGGAGPGAPPVLVACSGGPDSLVLVHLAARGLDRPLHAVVIDHGLQAGSADVAARAAQAARTLGAAHAQVVRVDVRTGPGSGGLESAARDARYAALRGVAERADAPAVLLGHSADDQAETVLLGLARGSGARSLAGMSSRDGLWRRPLLGVRRADIHRHAGALALAGVPIWTDPHNSDSDFSRVRVRHMLGNLAEALRTDPVPALVRTAEGLRADNDALDALAEAVLAEALVPATALEAPPAESVERAGFGSLRVAPLAKAHAAVRTRAIRSYLLRSGASGGALTRAHVLRVDAFVTAWRGQGAVALPGGLQVVRQQGLIRAIAHNVAP